MFNRFPLSFCHRACGSGLVIDISDQPNNSCKQAGISHTPHNIKRAVTKFLFYYSFSLPTFSFFTRRLRNPQTIPVCSLANDVVRDGFFTLYKMTTLSFTFHNVYSSFFFFRLLKRCFPGSHRPTRGGNAHSERRTPIEEFVVVVDLLLFIITCSSCAELCFLARRQTTSDHHHPQFHFPNSSLLPLVVYARVNRLSFSLQRFLLSIRVATDHTTRTRRS